VSYLRTQSRLPIYLTAREYRIFEVDTCGLPAVSQLAALLVPEVDRNRIFISFVSIGGSPSHGSDRRRIVLVLPAPSPGLHI
jgi:hypothetical protein